MPVPEATPQRKAGNKTDRPAKGCAQWEALVRKYRWSNARPNGWDTRIAMAVMQAESGCRSDAVGDTWEIAGLLAPSCGLFQVRTLEGRPNCKWLSKPENNVKYAFGLYEAHGWQPWSAYLNGSYKKFLR